MNVQDIDTLCSFAAFSEKETLSKGKQWISRTLGQNLSSFPEGEAPLCESALQAFLRPQLAYDFV